jgi:hypothetical protein
MSVANEKPDTRRLSFPRTRESTKEASIEIASSFALAMTQGNSVIARRSKTDEAI